MPAKNICYQYLQILNFAKKLTQTFVMVVKLSYYWLEGF